MKTARLEAFSDGVIAIIITIMVLELKAPHEATLHGLSTLAPVFLSYVLSFAIVAIYWVNHHHLIHLVERVNARILWLNIHLLFWISLMPFATAFLGENCAEPFAVALYGALAAVCAVGYYLLRSAIMDQQRDDPKLRGLHLRMLRKNRIAIGLYVLSVPAAYLAAWLALALIVLPALMYFVPDHRAEDRRAE